MTIGARDVLIRIAPGFIMAILGAPIRPRERGGSAKWMLTASECDESASFGTRVASAACACSAVRFSPHASTVILSARSSRPCVTRAGRVR
jgi:hypothetical protein